MKVESKIIIVTGGGNGMGREIVLNLLSKGAKVIAIDINENALIETADLSGSNKNSLATFVVDITKREAVENFKEQAIARFGAVDGIINNAGIIQPFVKFNDLAYDVIERVFNVNLWGTVYMTKTLLPHLLTRPDAHIVNISSMGGFLPVPGQTIYCGAKAAVKLITEGLRSELLNSNVKVTVVFPGAINTNIKANSGLKVESNIGNHSNKALLPSIAAEIIVSAMETNKACVFVGKDSKFMDLLVRLNPSKASKLIFEKMKSKLGM